MLLVAADEMASTRSRERIDTVGGSRLDVWAPRLLLEEQLAELARRCRVIRLGEEHWGGWQRWNDRQIDAWLLET